MNNHDLNRIPIKDDTSDMDVLHRKSGKQVRRKSASSRRGQTKRGSKSKRKMRGTRSGRGTKRGKKGRGVSRYSRKHPPRRNKSKSKGSSKRRSSKFRKRSKSKPGRKSSSQRSKKGTKSKKMKSHKRAIKEDDEEDQMSVASASAASMLSPRENPCDLLVKPGSGSGDHIARPAKNLYPTVSNAIEYYEDEETIKAKAIAAYKPSLARRIWNFLTFTPCEPIIPRKKDSLPFSAHSVRLFDNGNTTTLLEINGKKFYFPTGNVKPAYFANWKAVVYVNGVKQVLDYPGNSTGTKWALYHLTNSEKDVRKVLKESEEISEEEATEEFKEAKDQLKRDVSKAHKYEKLASKLTKKLSNLAVNGSTVQ